MSYRCETCNRAVAPNTPRCTHVVYKPGTKQTQREYAVCGECKGALINGLPLPDWTGGTKWVQTVDLTVHRDVPVHTADLGDDVPLV